MSFNQFRMYSMLSNVEGNKVVSLDKIISDLDIQPNSISATQYLADNYGYNGQKKFFIDDIMLEIEDMNKALEIIIRQGQDCYIYNYAK